MTMSISTGTKPRAQRLLIYGPEGIGKTTLAASMPAALIIDLEDGSDSMDVARIDPAPVTWDDLLETVRQFAAEGSGTYKTLVIDSLDVCERLVNAHVCRRNNWKSIEDAGYGKGYTRAAEAWGDLLDLLDKVIASGANVVLVGHAAMRKQELPEESGAFDRWELQLRGKTLGTPTKSWCDAVVFVNYRTTVVQGKTGAAKAKGGQRMAYASHRPTWDAKNRWGIPDSFTLDDAAGIIAAHMVCDKSKPAPKPNPKAAPKATPKAAAQKPAKESDAGPASGGYEPPAWEQPRLQGLKKMCIDRRITDLELRQACAERKRATLDTPVDEYSDELVAFIIGHFAQVARIVEKFRQRKAVLDAMPIPF